MKSGNYDSFPILFMFLLSLSYVCSSFLLPFVILVFFDFFFYTPSHFDPALECTITYLFTSRSLCLIQISYLPFTNHRDLSYSLTLSQPHG